MSLLSVSDLGVRFGGLTAVDHVTFDVEPGALVGLIGPNGAGKTTTIEAITGFVPGATGAVSLAGRRVDGLPPHRRARLGMVRTFQSVELFGDLTVRENLLAVAHRRAWWQSLVDTVAPMRHTAPGSVDEAIAFMGLADVADKRPEEISQGERKLAGVARALACRPALLLLDEPAAGLDSVESLALGRRLRAIADSGIGVLLVDHDMGLVLGACDYVIVLDFGKVLCQGEPAAVRGDSKVIAAYLGDDVLEIPS